MTLPFHPLANLFPLIEGDDYAALVADIKANGLRDAIVIYDGLILDGRNRARACEDADRPPRYEPFVGAPSEVIGYVLSKNLARRHLNDSQRAWIAARLCGDEPPFGGLLEKEAAERLHVRLRTVERAVVVRKKARPEIRTYVEAGDLPIATAAGIAELGQDDQDEIVADIKGAKGPLARRALTLLKQKMRSRRERDLALKIISKAEGKFGIILEDFEWDHETWSEAGKNSRHASNHYETSSDAHTAAEIVERTKDRFECADENSILLAWATIPHLAIAIDVMRLRGYEYKSHYIWNKDRAITGYWSRAKHELLLIGTKGKVVCPAPGTQRDSVIDAPLQQHSQKPDEFLDMIFGYFPNIPKIELNARRRRPGWQVWGNETKPAPQWRINFETEALRRGLIDKTGSVRVREDAIVSFDYVTEGEWHELLGFDPITGEIISPPAQPQVIAQPLEAEEPLLIVEFDALDIPPFLDRRVPVASASNSNASAAGPPNEG